MPARSGARSSPEAVWLATAGLVVAALKVQAVAPFYAAGPPPAHTGGFQEPSCRECHQGAPLNDAVGSLTIESLPPSYEPNRDYPLTVVLMRPGMLRAGFQLAVRTHDGVGRQAGDLAPTDDRATLHPVSVRPIQYLQHTRAGTTLRTQDTARWSFTWRAPAGRRPVVFHVAANAANDDDSPFGDFVYTREFVLLPIR